MNTQKQVVLEEGGIKLHPLNKRATLFDNDETEVILQSPAEVEGRHMSVVNLSEEGIVHVRSGDESIDLSLEAGSKVLLYSDGSIWWVVGGDAEASASTQETSYQFS